MRIRSLALCAGIMLLSVPAFAEPLSFQPPGFMLPNSGVGHVDTTVHAPDMRFPLEEGIAYLNSQVYRPGGSKRIKTLFPISGSGDGDQCDARNYSYPWQDNFCESRSHNVPACSPGGRGHQGQDIRPKTCHPNVHWVVAVVDGTIIDIGRYSVILQGTGGRRYRYLHMEPNSLQVQEGDQVTKGQRIGRVSNYYVDESTGEVAPTTFHLHFDLMLNSANNGYQFVSPYMSLVTAFQRLNGESTGPVAQGDGTSTPGDSTPSTGPTTNVATGPSTGPTGSTDSASQDPSPADVARIAKIVGKGRYMERQQCQAGQSPATDKCCQTVAQNDPLMSTVLAPYTDYRLPGNGHLGLADCRYDSTNNQTQVTLETRVIMLNPTAEQVALWTISACRKALAQSLDKCAQWVWSSIFINSGTQFAVTGPVIEPNATDCRSDDASQPSDVGYTFRDGVTVRLGNVDGVCDGDAERLAGEPSIYFADDAIRSTPKGPSRVTMMTRQSYQSYFGGALIGRERGADGDIPWLKLVRDTHMKALGSPSHPWLDKIVAVNLPATAKLP